MITFLLCVAFLVVGYAIYGKFVAGIFEPDDRETPAVAINDGVDYVPMPTWKVFLIQLLNIAGTGPIFGALGGALFGPVAYLWIIFGNIFAVEHVDDSTVFIHHISQQFFSNLCRIITCG